MKIRIGNDIRLNLQLAFNDVNADAVNILGGKVYFINTTLKEKFEKEYKNKNRFIGRFPIEPYLNEFQPNEYCINSCGNPTYRAFVANEYKGFGPKPNWNKSFPIGDVNLTTYQAEFSRTVHADTIDVIFPAEAQLYPGQYELVFVAEIYAPGFSRSSRTITTNYKNVFELVSDSANETTPTGEDTEVVNQDVKLVISRVYADNGVTAPDVYTVRGTYNNGNIALNRNDGETVNVDLSSATNWYEGE